MGWTRGPVIGHGSTATVSVATSLPSGELFAVKSAELSNSKFLQKEQRVLSKLSCNPFIVKYLGFDITCEENNKPTYNLRMEYVAGGTLHDLIKRHGGQLDEHTIRTYTRHILQGLDYLHTNRLVHCDVKSQNILINKDGAKIADFGCARFINENGATNYGGGVFSGTPMFMAPEVARGEEQGFPADVWAVGCTIIEMATGSYPWAELDDPVSALYSIGFSTVLPEFPSRLSETAKDFLSKCLRWDPKERWRVKELLGHPFLAELELESKEGRAFTMTSPSCVLEYQGFWDTVLEALESSSDQELTPETCSKYPPAERIKSLIESTYLSVQEAPEWTWEADWVTVRTGYIEETRKNEILVNEHSAASTFLLLNSVFIHQPGLESSISVEDLLFKFYVDDSVNTISIGGHIFVPKYLNFETDNDSYFCFHQALIPLT